MEESNTQTKPETLKPTSGSELGAASGSEPWREEIHRIRTELWGIITTMPDTDPVRIEIQARITSALWSLAQRKTQNSLALPTGGSHEANSSSGEVEYQRQELERENARMRALLTRYRNETPLGNQPHMIAHQVDAALANAEGLPSAGGDRPKTEKGN